MRTIKELLKELIDLCEDKKKARSLYLKILRELRKKDA